MNKAHRPPRSLHEYLEREGLTQRALARKAAMSESQLSAILRGDRGCSLAVALRLSAASGVAVENIAKRQKMCAVRSFVAVA